MKEIKILNISILSISVKNLLKNLNSGILFTPNVDHLVKLQKDKEFYEVYEKADWITCDSKILGLTAKILGVSFEEVIPGSSFFHYYYNYHKNDKSISIFLLGAAEGVADIAMENINKKVGRKMVVGAFSPKYGFEKDDTSNEEIHKIINKSGANVLVVGLGAPKQEKWIIKNKEYLPNIKLTMALGATIDFEAGHIKRAPIIYRKLHVEWIYRLFREPKRLWKRYLVDDMYFFKYILQQKLGKYKNPFI